MPTPEEVKCFLPRSIKSYTGTIKATLSDSQTANELLKRIFIIDSTTISLFKAIMKCVGRKPLNGKSKGGIKVHTMLNVYEEAPQLIHFTDAATHDHTFLSQLKLHPPHNAF